MGRSLALGSHDYVQTLKGQKLRFPNLNAIVEGWPKGCSSHLKVLRDVQHKDLLKLMGPGKGYDICESTDCPYFVSVWWPNADYEALRFAAQLVTFLYLWDDDTDNPELTNLVSDLDASNKFRDASIAHFERYLADNPPPGNPTDPPAIPTLRSFNPIGEAAMFRMTRSQRLRMLDELYRYMRACEIEQHSELSGRAPTVDEYVPCRMGTSAAGFVTSILEYMVKVDLGDTIRYDPDVVEVFDQTICLIAIMNDMFSLRRELRYPFYNNVVAVLYHQHGDLQTAVDETYKIIQRSAESFEAAARRALEKFPDRKQDLTTWINGAKNMVTGNMAWSMHIKRYDLKVSDLDGTTEITI
ncbi:hypothetical protein DL766_006131 [Monosporascus sp. MC13-8B]|uniref:Terpene synthase n=1 Tax=Monosporascus cannonballus TaxID=155416 RepID=A0ABY0HCE8_9PEZI|nr:hypothetical protein DL762_002817 [Monosporascus cannonballus]RYO97578.1 hypothetical protein DL763_002691 [Monosporascus cannonballus]RYP27942.1 hypothetical protein DL766_006131 [Monosporascus sp. MC13-8B]